MEYATEVKKIGGSAYLRLPPSLVKNYNFKDKSEIILRESNSLIIMDTNGNEIDEHTRNFLNMRFHLGGKGISREEIYETDRY